MPGPSVRPGDGAIHLVRHAHALDRHHWEEPDECRPLSGKGRRQALDLALRLAGTRPRRLLTSPALRCRESLEPLSATTGLALEEQAWLAEGSPPAEALEQLLGALGSLGAPSAPGSGGLVACTHGDVLDGVLEQLVASGVPLEGTPRAEKAGTFTLVVEEGDLVLARHVPAPSGEPAPSSGAAPSGGAQRS